MAACECAVKRDFAGGIVYILPGLYEFAKTIQIPHSCCVIGDQTTELGMPNTIFHFSNSSYENGQGCLLLENSSLKNVRIETDGQKDFYAISTVESNATIENCYFRSPASLLCYYSCTINKCSFEDGAQEENPSIDFGVPTGFINSGSGKVTISECSFLGEQFFPVRVVQHPIGEEGYNLTIINSRFASVRQYKYIVNDYLDRNPGMSIPYFYGNRALQYETPTQGALPSTIPEKYLDKSGDTMTGPLVLSGDPTKNLEAATKQYVDNHTVSAMVYDIELPKKPSTPIADGQEIPYTWEQINAITLAGKAQEYFSLGATKLVNLSTAVLGANAATMMVIGFNQDGENTTTFQTKGLLPTATAFGSSAVWIGSTARTQCQNFYNACEAKSFIKIVSKGTCLSIKKNSRNETPTYNDETVWLPSEREMGYNSFAPISTANSTAFNAECTKGYNAGYSYYTSDATRIKYQMNSNGMLTTTSGFHWLRSRYYNDSGYGIIVWAGGSSSYNAYNNNNYLAPAFVIGNGTPSAKITQDGEDITDKVKRLVGGDGSKVGDIKVTTRTDLGDNWLLCNGSPIDSTGYPELSQFLSTTISQNSYENWVKLWQYRASTNTHWNRSTTDQLSAINIPISATSGTYDCIMLLTDSNGAIIINETITSENDYHSIAFYNNTLYLGYLNSSNTLCFDTYTVANKQITKSTTYTTNVTAADSYNYNLIHTISSAGKHVLVYQSRNQGKLIIYSGTNLTNLSTSATESFSGATFVYYIDSNHNIWIAMKQDGYYSYSYFLINTTALTIKYITNQSNYTHKSFVEYNGNMILTFQYYNDSNSVMYLPVSLTDGTTGTSASYSTNSSYGDVYLFNGLYWSIRISYTNSMPTYYTYTIHSYNSPTTSTYQTNETLVRHTSNDYDDYYTVFPYEKLATYVSFNNFVFAASGYILTNQPRLPLISQDSVYTYIKAKEESV